MMLRMRFPALMLVAGLATACSAGQQPATTDADEKPTVVKELKLKGLQPTSRPGKVAKPTVVKTADALAKAFPDEKLRDRIKGQVDFDKQFLLYFRWAGSGQDQLTARVVGTADPQVVIDYKPGRTRDFRPHVRLYVVQNGVSWKLAAPKRAS